MVDNGGDREKTSGMVGALPLLPTELSFWRCRAQAKKKKSVASLSLRLVENPIASWVLDVYNTHFKQLRRLQQPRLLFVSDLNFGL